MRKKQKQLLVLFTILILTGLILAISSSIYSVKDNEILEENGRSYSISVSASQKIEYGTNITRPFKIGEKMTARYTHNFTPPYPDILCPINFTILSPNGEATIFWFWLDPISNPSTGQTYIVVTNLTVYKVEGLKKVEASGSKFICEATENGKYTLIFTSNYTTLRYMAFVKILSIKEYPYAYLLPFGIVLVIAGTTPSIWILNRTPKKTKKSTRTK